LRCAPTWAAALLLALPAPARAAEGRRGRPVPQARVLLWYVDGLRPDVLRAMAAEGLLPNLRRVFVDGGVACPRAFTVFPSNTLIANGALFTGRFSDRTGVKAQHQFERSMSIRPAPWRRGPAIQPMPDAREPRVINLLDKYAPADTHQFLTAHGVPTLGSRLGKAFRFTTLPILPINPPPQWFHRAVNTLGPLGLSVRLPTRLDLVNAHYLVEDLLGDPDARVIAAWFPQADKTCHTHGRGQFGPARQDLLRVDEYFGWALARLREVGWLEQTYFLLVSDHGHVGGDQGVNRRANLPRDWAHRALGCNARVVGRQWTHAGISPERFVFVDNQGAGQAKIFLPNGSYFFGAWRRNRLYDLTHYQLRPSQPSVNLLESLAAFRGPEAQADDPAPVDLVLVKLDDHRVFVYRDAQRQALISRLPGVARRPLYRYEPVSRLEQSPDGALHFEAAVPGQDPLGYLQDPGFRAPGGAAAWLAEPHTDREWLEATADTRYPDAVVGFSTFFAWQPPLEGLAALRDPDVVVTAAPGWSFRSDDGEGTDHGSPLADAARMTLFAAGPGLSPGTVQAPQRIVDVLPTILEMVGAPYDPDSMDGRPIPLAYE
jgi:arylsulfatase A-like enzyme